MSRPVVTLLALSTLPSVWVAAGFWAHHGYHGHHARRPHLGKRMGHLARGNQKEAGHLRRKSSKDVGPYLDKESFLHSSGFFGEGFMPNLSPSVVKKRQQATEKPTKKRPPVKMGFPKMMLNSLMQRLNLPNMKQLLNGMKKSKRPKKSPIKGADEYPYPFHSIQPNPAKSPSPNPPQKTPNGLLTPELDRPLFLESPYNENPLFHHQLAHSGEEGSQSLPPSSPTWQTTSSPASGQKPFKFQVSSGGFSQDDSIGATQHRFPIPTAALSLSPTKVPITPFVHQPSLNRHQQSFNQYFSQTGNLENSLPSSSGKSRKPLLAAFVHEPSYKHGGIFSTLQTFETIQEDKDATMSFVHTPSLSDGNENVFSAVKGFSLEDMGESMAAFERTPALPPKPNLNKIFSKMTNFETTQKNDSPMAAFVHSSPSDLGNTINDEADTFPPMRPFVHESSLHENGEFESFFPPPVTSLTQTSKPPFSAPLQPVAAVWTSQVSQKPKDPGPAMAATTFSPFDKFSEESSPVIGLELRRQTPVLIEKNNGEETTAMSISANTPRTLYRKDTNKMKKRYFTKKTQKGRIKKKKESFTEENDRTSALKRLLSIAGPDWSKVEKPDG